MTSSKADDIVNDYIRNIDKFEAELGRKLSKDEIIENIFQEFVRISDLETKAIEKTFEKQGIDINKSKSSFSAEFFGSETRTAKVQTLTDLEKEKRLALRNKLFRNFITNAYESSEEKDIEVIKNDYFGGPTRNTQAFLGNHVINSETGLKGTDVGKALAGKELTSQEKQKLMSDYIDGVAKETSKIAKECTSDEDYVNKMNAISEAGRFYSVDNINQIYEEITHESISKETNAKYLADRELLQTVWSYKDVEFSKIADPLYLKVTSKSQDAISKAAKESDYYNPEDNDLYNSRDDEKVYTKIKFGSSYGREPLTMRADTLEFHKVSTEEKLFSAVQTRLDIDDHTPYYGEHGGRLDLSNGNKNKIFTYNKVFIARRPDGKDFYITKDKMDFVQYKEIPEKTDNTAKYREMLKILNSGTRALVRSSKEYKNMRNILGKLTDGKHAKDETKLLGQFAENMDKYMENFENKINKSEIAYIRKDCVEKVKNMFGDMHLCALAQDINAPHKEKEDLDDDKEFAILSEKKESSPVRKNISIDEAKDKSNSSFFKEEKQEEKALEKINEKRSWRIRLRRRWR